MGVFKRLVMVILLIQLQLSSRHQGHGAYGLAGWSVMIMTFSSSEESKTTDEKNDGPLS